MNSKDLTLSAIKGVPEKIPFNPFIMHLAATIVDVDYCHDYVQKPEVLADAQIKTARFFGIDHVNVSTDAYREASAWGVEIDWSSNTPAAKPSSFLDWREFDSYEDPDLLSSTRIQNRISAVKILKQKVGTGIERNCVVGWIEAPFAEICCLFGLMNVLKIARKPNWEKIMGKLVKRIQPIQLEFAKLQIEAGADIIGAGDSAISQIGPKRYEKCFVNATRDLFTDIKKNAPVLYHVCGDNDIVDKEGRNMVKLISGTGADIIDFDYQLDLKKVKEMVGKKNCIRGNTNTQILGSSAYSSTEVIREVSKTLEEGKPGGKFMYAAGCEWPWKPKDLAVRNLSIAKTLTESLGKY